MTYSYIKEITLRPCSGGGRGDKSPYHYEPRVYIHIDGESIIENLENRRTRPYTFYKKNVLPVVFEVLGLQPEKASWSQKAGCTMCPCSPGFILRESRLNFDIHVTITDKMVREIQIGGSLMGIFISND